SMCSEVNDLRPRGRDGQARENKSKGETMERVAQQVAALARMSAKALRARYREVFGEEAKTGNAAWLRSRIAWRLQSLAEGGLRQRARQRAGELANDPDLRMNARVVKPVVTGSTDPAPRLATLPTEV